MADSPRPGRSTRAIAWLLRTFFRLLYHQFAWTYDWVADLVSVKRWRTWVLLPLPLLGDAGVLELGCGPGHLQVASANQNRLSYGLDASPQMVRLAARRLSGQHLQANLVQGEAQNLPFRNSSFHQVVSTFPSDYIYQPETIQQVYRVLDEAGELIILPAAWITGDNLVDRIAAWLFRVTNQAPDASSNGIEGKIVGSFQFLSDFGFVLYSSLLNHQGSQILVIQARKEAPGS